MLIHKQLFFRVAPPTKRNQIIESMALAVPIGIFMMNLDSINATAKHAFLPIALSCYFSNDFPFRAISTNSSSAPEVTFFASVRKSFLSFFASVGASKFCYCHARFKWSRANCTFPRFFTRSIPSAAVITIHRAKLCVWIACGSIKSACAVGTYFIGTVFWFSGRNTNRTFIPCSPWPLQRTGTAAINAALSPDKVSVADRADVVYWLHSHLSKNAVYHIEPKYFDIACQRIEQAYAQGQLFKPAPLKQEQESLI